jgi:predicted double-glycine peptidase
MEGMMAHGEREKIVARRGFSLLDMKRYLATLGAEGNGFRADMN